MSHAQNLLKSNASPSTQDEKWAKYITQELIAVEGGSDNPDFYSTIHEALKIYSKGLIETVGNLQAKLTRQEGALEFAMDKVFELIPDEHTTESPEEYYERVTEGELPKLYDALLKRKAELADAGEVS